jgi:hypothetical protein
VYDPFDDGSDGQKRFWLFLAYVVSFAALVGAVWNLVANYGVCVLLLFGLGLGSQQHALMGVQSPASRAFI